MKFEEEKVESMRREHQERRLRMRRQRYEENSKLEERNNGNKVEERRLRMKRERDEEKLEERNSGNKVEERRLRMKRQLRDEEKLEERNNGNKVEERGLRVKRQLRDEEKQLEGRNNGNKVARRVPGLQTAGPQVPEGWLDCPNMGEPVGGFLIPSKVPLGELFNGVIPKGKHFSKKQVLRKQRIYQRQVALVIDLTNTNRCYSPQEWHREGVEYLKLRCRGRDEVPQPEPVNRFVYEMIKFQQNVAAKAPDRRCVLVHCTHGHNRTGYMIVHYLMRTQYRSVEKCLRLFAEARPPGIYKLDYIKSLYKFYNERRPEPLPCPLTPEWKRRTEVDSNGVQAEADDENDDDDRGTLAAVQEDDDDVLGDAIPEEQQLEMQKYICSELGLKLTGKHPPIFPGSQPVSLNRKNLKLLRQRYYYATWKADGTRYMMFLARDGCYLIDREFRFRRVELRFPVLKIGRDASPETHHLTLLDGEMVIDTLPGNIQSRRYLVYDLLILKAASLSERPFHERWKLIKDEVIDPRSAEKRRGGRYMYEAEKFSVRRKDFYMLSVTDRILTDLIPTLPHEADGLILKGWEDLYVPRTHDGLLKWKYGRMNSVDFLLQVSRWGQHRLLLMESGKLKQLHGAEVTFPEDQDSSTMAGKVIECSWNPKENHWEFMRIRKDKKSPNTWHVYEKVLASLHDKITEEVLLEEIKEICQLPAYVDSMAKDLEEWQKIYENTQ